jgi:hypothetical protein
MKANDPNNVAIIVGGIPIQGFGTGDFLKISQKEDTFTSTTGADGETIRSKSNPKPIVEITLTLMESSASNTFLSSLHEIDRAQPNGAGVVPFLYKDGSGTSLFVSDQSWVAKPPDMTKGKEGKEREWKLEAVTKTRLDGQM